MQVKLAVTVGIGYMVCLQIFAILVSCDLVAVSGSLSGDPLCFCADAGGLHRSVQG